ncbi:threonine ammonia-lyase [Salinicoccus luteus]|uniref:threonine ammonia-lyase n=1 Tax=Salinicoccus luteus TaxID=367840 RepID=UPI0004E21077|nr:threonine/serine dehydratase [Salinicoccus luteus]
MTVTLGKIREAQSRIGAHVVETPLHRAHALDRFLGCEVYLKLENTQVTGAFKYRGAISKILKLSNAERQRGIITASSGNHGKALAHAARELGIEATVVIPDTAPPFKASAIEQLGAHIVQTEVTERFAVSERMAKENGYTLFHPYDDDDIMAGQGTVGLELMAQHPSLDTVIVPTSGGGLLGGILTAIKESASGIRIFGAEPAAVPRYSESLEHGGRMKVESRSTIADALVSVQPGARNFPVVQKYADGMLKAGDESILKAMKMLLMEGKILAEPSAAVGLAAVLEDAYAPERDEKVCFVISGGNVGFDQLGQLENIRYDI